MIYLDSASTEKLHPEAKKAMLESFDRWANPSSLSQEGKLANYTLEKCREEIKETFNIQNDANLIFVSSASEANNIVFNESTLPILISNYEHPSIFKHPKVTDIIDFEDLTNLELKLKENKYLISISLVNNESGMMILTDEIIALIKKYRSKLHVDASQAKDIDFSKINCDYMTISSHKIGGPIGIAALIFKPLISTVIYGGGQEYNIRSGTQPLPLIEGFNAAAKKLKKRQFNDKMLINLLKNNIDKKYFFSNFVNKNFADHIICLLTYNKSGSELHAYMDMNDIIISYGSACSSGAINAPIILSKFNLPSSNGIRISFGWHSTEGDVLSFCKLFNKIK